MKGMDNKYFFLALLLSAAVCAAWLFGYERKKGSTLETVLIAVLVAFASLGRVVFAALPHFKPVTAIVIISGASLGPGAGFVTGALTAAVSNMYYGQGPWTPFQMAAWGLIGALSGIIGKYIRKSTPKLIAFGVLCGVLYSLLMDVCTVLMSGESFSPARYVFYVSASLPVMAVYAVSDGIFLWLLGKPMCRRLDRIRIKYIE